MGTLSPPFVLVPFIVFACLHVAKAVSYGIPFEGASNLACLFVTNVSSMEPGSRGKSDSHTAFHFTDITGWIHFTSLNFNLGCQVLRLPLLLINYARRLLFLLNQTPDKLNIRWPNMTVGLFSHALIGFIALQHLAVGFKFRKLTARATNPLALAQTKPSTSMLLAVTLQCAYWTQFYQASFQDRYFQMLRWSDHVALKHVKDMRMQVEACLNAMRVEPEKFRRTMSCDFDLAVAPTLVSVRERRALRTNSLAAEKLSKYERAMPSWGSKTCTLRKNTLLLSGGQPYCFHERVDVDDARMAHFSEFGAC
jgi:hypothetical protein